VLKVPLNPNQPMNVPDLDSLKLLLTALLHHIECKWVLVWLCFIYHLSVCLSVLCIVERWLIGSGSCLGMVGRLGPGMRQLVVVGDCPMASSNFEVDVRHPVVTSMDFLA